MIHPSALLSSQEEEACLAVTKPRSAAPCIISVGFFFFLHFRRARVPFSRPKAVAFPPASTSSRCQVFLSPKLRFNSYQVHLGNHCADVSVDKECEILSELD